MIGSASMSARSATAGGSSASPPMSAMSPVPFGKIAGCKPAPSSSIEIRRVVRCSEYPTSGCACRSRRNSINSDSCTARNASSSPVRSCSTMHPLPHGNDQAAITLTSLETHALLENAWRPPIRDDAMTQIQAGSQDLANPDLINTDLPGNERVHLVLQAVVSLPKPGGTDELEPGIRKSASTTLTTR